MKHSTNNRLRQLEYGYNGIPEVEMLEVNHMIRANIINRFGNLL